MKNFEESTPQTCENHYFVLPERTEVDKLSFINCKCGQNTSLIIILIIIAFPVGFILPEINPVISINIIIIFITIFISIFFNCKSKKELIKDKSNNKISIIEQNFICCKKTLNLSLEYTVLKSKGTGIECNKEVSSIITLNIDPNAIDLDLDNSKIKNTPFKFIYNLG